MTELTRYQKEKESNLAWRKRNPKKFEKAKKAYYKRTKERWLLYAERDRDIKRFGGNKRFALERDDWSCILCGMNNEQHILIFGQAITVDHKDNDRENNDLTNLQTLCLRCHGRKDGGCKNHKVKCGCHCHHQTKKVGDK